MRASLISTYELGRQPFGLASAAAWLADAGADVDVQDLAVCAFEPDSIHEAGFIGVYVPMHTATRLAENVIARVREISTEVPIACFGLYASMNADHLLALGATTVIGGEFEVPLVEAFERAQRGAMEKKTVTELKRRPFKVPLRSGLPELDKYARLQTPTGPTRVTGYTEATRGCKHMCRHCPIPPIYGGRFTIVDPDVVLADVTAQIAAGAQHLTFGDPDFFNGPAHSLRIVRRIHEEFPDLTYDVTIKVQHLVDNLNLLSVLQETGCVLITTAVESFDPKILERFDKQHTDRDLEVVVTEMNRIGLALNPTFVAFTPWTSVDGYLRLLTRVAELGLVDNVSPVQYGIRLLVPSGSLILDLPDAPDLFGAFDQTALAHPWSHPDLRMDELQATVIDLVSKADSRRQAFTQVWRAARRLTATDTWPLQPPLDESVPIATVPYLTEPWYC